MKVFLAYALLLVGIPMYLGALAGMLTAPLAWPFSDARRGFVMDLLLGLQGIVSVGVALLIFKILAVPAGISVLIILSAWIAVYLISFSQSPMRWIMHFVGIFTGWFLCFHSLHQ
jgi:hypothetical protein